MKQGKFWVFETILSDSLIENGLWKSSKEGWISKAILQVEESFPVDKQSHPTSRGKLSQTYSNILSTELHKPKLSRHDLAITKHAI